MGYGFLRPTPLAATLAGVPALALPQGNVWGTDGIGMRYRFAIYDIRARPAGLHVVYAFARLEGQIYVPLYIGRAESLSQRLPGHERLDEALRRGARHLLVHMPAARDPIGYADAERRLIRHYAPPLNEQHNPLATLLSR